MLKLTQLITFFSFLIVISSTVNAAAQEDFDNIKSTPNCGEMSPSFYYFNKLAPTFGYPLNVSHDPSEVFTRKSMPPNHNVGHNISPRLRPNIYLHLGELSKKYSTEEMDCWRTYSDQLALLEYGHVSSSEEFYDSLGGLLAYSRGLTDKSINYTVSGHWSEKQFEKLFNAAIDQGKFDKYLSFLERAAATRKDHCLIKSEVQWVYQPNCGPKSLFSVYENGVPEAHNNLYMLKTFGPVHLRNVEEANISRVKALLLGSGDIQRVINPFTCKNYRLIENSEVFSKIFVKTRVQDTLLNSLTEKDVQEQMDSCQE